MAPRAPSIRPPWTARAAGAAAELEEDGEALSDEELPSLEPDVAVAVADLVLALVVELT